MKLMVAAPMYWRTLEEAEQRCWIYLASCRKAGIGNGVRHYFGVGCPQYPGDTEMRVVGLARFLGEHAGDFTHILFTDAWDQIFTGTFEQIQERYQSMGCPPFLHAAAIQRGNVHTQEFDEYFPATTPFRFFGAGFIAEIPLVLDWFQRLDVVHTHDSSDGYFKGWRDGWFRPQLDVQCELFQTVDLADGLKYFEVRDGQPYNNQTGTWPLILHFGGYVYVDPVTGKDRIIEPWAKRLGIL